MVRVTIAAILVATPALAQTVPAPIPLGPTWTVSTLAGPTEVGRFSVELKAGADYALAVGGYGVDLKAAVRGPDGRTLATVEGGLEYVDGAEIRARATGKHLIEVRAPFPNTQFPAQYEIRVMTDCRASVQTQCRIRVGGAVQQRQHVDAFDDDWYKAELSRSTRTLTVSAPGFPMIVRLRDSKGRELTERWTDGNESEQLRFSIPRAGTYFFTIEGTQDRGGQYRISLR